MFRQGSLRDDRRRRSLVEDVATAADPGTPAKSRRASKSTERYTDLARSECHARWSNFVPLRNWTISALFAAGVLVIAALNAGYYFAVLSPLWPAGELTAVDLARADSLAGWWSALVMFVCAVLSVFVYSVRRFRLNDYRGRYRVWLWGGVLWLVLSIDGIANVRGAMRALGVAFSGEAGPGDGVLWWLAPWSVLVVWIGLRMVLDVRACRIAVASLILGFLGMAAGFVLPQLVLPIADYQAVVITATAGLMGRWFLFFGQVAYARHVLLDAHGQLPIRAVKAKGQNRKAERAADDSAGKTAEKIAKRRDDLTTRIDPPHTAAFRPATSGIDVDRPASQSSNSAKPQMSGTSLSARAPAAAVNAKPASTPTKTATQFISGDEDDEEPRQSNKLSRAERKRLRKQQRGQGYDDE